MAEITLLDRKLVRPVLVVEADHQVLDALTRQIRPTGLPVCTATTVEGARELLVQTAPLAAILDTATFAGLEVKKTIDQMRSDSPTSKFFLLAEAAERTAIGSATVDGVYGRAETQRLIKELYRLKMA
jgi:DNA-binding NtrC family response regulator